VNGVTIAVRTRPNGARGDGVGAMGVTVPAGGAELSR